MASNLLDLTKNNILNGNISLYQPKKGFRIGVDSILLASSVNNYSNCIEFGTGSGIILIYLSKKFPNSKILSRPLDFLGWPGFFCDLFDPGGCLDR